MPFVSSNLFCWKLPFYLFSINFPKRTHNKGKRMDYIALTHIPTANILLKKPQTSTPFIYLFPQKVEPPPLNLRDPWAAAALAAHGIPGGAERFPALSCRNSLSHLSLSCQPCAEFFPPINFSENRESCCQHSSGHRGGLGEQRSCLFCSGSWRTMNSLAC